jgi:hypothetical protein
MAKSIEDLYQQYAGRASDPEGLAYWTRDFGDTIDANEISIFQNAVAAARAQGTEPAAQPALTASQIANTPGMGVTGIGTSNFTVPAVSDQAVTSWLQSNPGASDATIAAAMNQFGVTPDQMARVTGLDTGAVQARYDAALPAAATPTYFQQNPDVAAAYQANSYGMTPDQFAAAHFQNYGANEQRAAPNTATTGALGQVATTAAAPDYEQMVRDAYGSIGRTGIGTEASNIDQAGFDNWVNALKTGSINPADLSNTFRSSVADYLIANPTDQYSTYVADYLQQNNAPEISGVQQLYQDVLGRDADASGLGTFYKQFGSEISPEERALFEQSARPELQSRVRDLYKDMLGRDAEQEGVDYWTKQFGSDITDAERELFRQSAAAELTGAFGGETPDDAGLLAGFKRAKDLGISDDVLKRTLGEELFNKYDTGLTNFAVTNLTNIVADNQLTWDESQKIHNFGRDLGFTPDDLARMTGQDKSLFELADTTYKAGRDQIINGSLAAPTVTSDADRVLTSLALQDKFGFSDEELSAATGVDVNTIKSSLDPVRNFSTTFSSTVNSPDTTTAQLKTLIADSRSNAAINKMYGESLNGIETKLNGLEQKWSSQQGVDPLQAENLFQQLEAQKNALGGQYYSGVFGDTMNMAAVLNRKGLETIDDLGQKDKFQTDLTYKTYTGPNGETVQAVDGGFVSYVPDGNSEFFTPDQVTTSVNKVVYDGPEGEGRYVPLTAEELATLKDDGTYQKKIGTVVIDKDTGAELTNTDGVLAMQRSGGHLKSRKHYINVGFTEDGRPILTASQEKSGLYGAVSELAPMVLTIASFIPGPHQPFARLANAALALEQDNYLGAVLSGLSAFGSFTGNELATLRAAEASGDIVNASQIIDLQNTLANVKLATTFVQGAAALQAENLPALINAGLSAYTQMSDTPLPSGVTTAVQLGNLGIAIENKQYDQALNALGDLTGSQDVKIAGSAKTLIDEFSKAEKTGDFSGVINAGLGLVDAVNARPTTQVDQGGITNRIVDDNISTVSQGEGDAGAAAFAAAKSAGASDEDALAAANAVTGVVINKIPDAGPSNVVTTSYLPAEEVKTERTRLAEEFAAYRGKTIDKLTAEEVDNFVDKIDSAIASGGSAVLKGASIQDILSGNYAALPTDEKGFTYNEQGVPRVEVIGGTKVDAQGNPITGQTTTTGSQIATNVADAIVENITGLEGTTGKIVQQGLSTLLGGIGEQVADISTSFGNMGLISRDNAGVTAGKYLEDIGKRLQLPETKQALDNWVTAVDKEPTYFGKIAAGVKGVIQNPLVLTEVVKEVGQEILPGAIGLKIAKYAGLAAGVASSTVLNALESAGATGRQTYEEEIAKGTPPAEAARKADRSAGYAGIITLATSGITDAAIAKRYGAAIEDFLGKKTSSAGGEFVQEGLEEGLIALATGKTPAEALTQSVVGSLVGAKTSGTIQTAADVQADLVSSFASQGLKSTDGSFKADTIVPIDSAASSVVSGEVASEADSAVTGDAASEAAPVVVGDVAVKVPDTSLVASDGSSGTSGDVAVSEDGGVTTTVSGNTTTTFDANSNITSQTKVDGNTQTTVVADANNNTTTQTVVDTKTGTTKSTTVDNTTKSTTQTTIAGDTQTTVLTNPTTNTQTTVKVNVNTGDVIEVKETEIPTDWKQPEIKSPDVKPPYIPPTAVADEAASKTPKAKPKKLGEDGGAGGVGGAGLPLGIGVDPASLRSKVTGGAIDPLERVKQAQAELEREVMMNQIDPRLLSVIQQRTNPNQQAQQLDTDVGALAKMLRGDSDAPANEGRYYSYGSEDSIDDILGGKAANYKEGGFVEPLKASGGSMALPLLAKTGGALGHYKGRENFKEGKHVAGEGDGQSDDIPAWLADGEFVFPADVVSALGNGSTKAGTDKLYEMMHNIRDRARSKGPKDLPPPALKSPLDYLKSSKRSSK